MYWLKITEENAETHEKDDQTLSVQVNLASFLTRATRSSFSFPISKGRKPVASSNTESINVKCFSPSTVLPLLCTSIKAGCLE